MKFKMLGMFVTCCLIAACGSAKTSSSANVEPEQRATEASVELADGAYIVHAESENLEELREPSADEVMLPFNDDDGDTDAYLVINTTPDVPFDLKTPATTKPLGDNKFSIHLQFTDAASQKLAQVTTQYVHNEGRLANVIGGKVVSWHKIQEPVTGGQAMITCCDFSQCERLIQALNDRDE